MSWFEACSIYKERHGKWVVAKPGTPEHAEIQEIYNELRCPHPVPELPPVAPKLIKPMEPICEGVCMIPKIQVRAGPTCEEIEAERCKKLAEAQAKAANQERIAKESYERYTKQIQEEEERERIKVSIRLNAPKRVATGVGRKRSKKTGEMVKVRRVDVPKIISFD